MKRNKHLNKPTELGPWPLSIEVKDDDDEEGVGQNETISNTIDYFQQQSFRLPKI